MLGKGWDEMSGEQIHRLVLQMVVALGLVGIGFALGNWFGGAAYYLDRVVEIVPPIMLNAEENETYQQALQKSGLGDVTSISMWISGLRKAGRVGVLPPFRMQDLPIGRRLDLHVVSWGNTAILVKR